MLQILVVMVDDAHERSISTDIVLGLLKKIQRRRSDLHLIISSATIEAKSMSDFFQPSSRRYRVQKRFQCANSLSDYVRAAVSTVLLIHDKEPFGDILVFLTGLIVLPLYLGLPRAEQDLIFSPTPRGKRKVVISTNIAETSLTLEGVVYVIDSGFSKQQFYNPDVINPAAGVVHVSTNVVDRCYFSMLNLEITDIENLVVAPISQASARQRAGRAGRVRPGKCYYWH
ncbi:hypothetical protein MLD38_037066 [Melastoma candidum]|uniref:Uncharacterized protein n=1 Tax=Melastoma candidum TaxID=119954 RepID=A0ACB9LNG1_9MYRT|nr:hypothetical protein MLD38_037066 [Melastoma candidum]